MSIFIYKKIRKKKETDMTVILVPLDSVSKF